MALRPLTLVSLCDGYAGTELALRSVAQVRTVCRVERDSYAAAVLVARMEEARLDQAPVWDDLHTFDGRAWRDRVDIVAAGFPCQPFSSAGRRGGTNDDRWLWPQIARIVAEVRPSFVLLENVRGLIRHGLPLALQDLADLGFDAEWGLYSAAAVGASHKRERVWIVAHAADGGLKGRRVPGRPFGETLGVVDGSRSTGDGEDVADTTSVDEREPHHAARPFAWRDSRQDAGWRSFPPGPDDHAGWVDYIAQGGPEPVVRRSTDGPPAGLADQLHLGGNGLVPQCAAHAWLQLADRLTEMGNP